MTTLNLKIQNFSTLKQKILTDSPFGERARTLWLTQNAQMACSCGGAVALFYGMDKMGSLIFPIFKFVKM